MKKTGCSVNLNFINTVILIITYMALLKKKERFLDFPVKKNNWLHNCI